MPNTIREADRDNWDIYRTVNPIIQSWLGVTGKGVALTNTQVSDADKYALDAANAGTGTKALRAVAGAHSLTVNSAGITLSSLTLSGNLTIGGTLTVTGATVLNGAVTLGDAAGDAITVTGTATFAQGTTFSSSIQVSGAAVLQSSLTVSGAATLNGAVTLGDAAGDTVTVTGTATFAQGTTFSSSILVNGAAVLQSSLSVAGAAALGDANGDAHTLIGTVTSRNAASTAFPLYLDPANARAISGSTTALGSDTTPCLQVVGRLYVAPDSANDLAIQVRRSSAATVGWSLGMTSDNDFVFKDDAGSETFRVGDTDSTYQAKVTGDLNVTDDAVITGDVSAGRAVFGSTTFSSTEELRVVGQSLFGGDVSVTSGAVLLSNTIFVQGLELGGTPRDLIGMTAADVVEVGDGTNVLRLFGQNIGYGGESFGSGTGVIFIGNRSAAPSSNPTGGGLLYAESGSLRWRGSGGTTTTIAPA